MVSVLLAAAVAMPIAVSSAGDGSVTLVDAATLQPLRTLVGEPSTLAMAVVADPVHGAFYVGNFKGGLARIAVTGSSDAAVLDVGGTAWMALSLDGRRLAAVSDQKLLWVDADHWKLMRPIQLGAVALPAQPLWIKEGLLCPGPDAALLFSSEGKSERRSTGRGAIHRFLSTPDGSVLALADGASGGKLEVLDHALKPVREIQVDLPPGEQPRLHGATLSPDGATVVVANMGSLREAGPTTVAAYDWKTGEKRWSVQTSRNAGHVAYLGPDRIVVVGHRAASIEILDAATGAPKESWEVLGAGSLGHALQVDPDGSVTILDSAIGRLLRYKDGARVAESPVLGQGGAESSLPQ